MVAMGTADKARPIDDLNIPVRKKASVKKGEMVKISIPVSTGTAEFNIPEGLNAEDKEKIKSLILMFLK